MDTLAATQGNTVVHRITLRDASGAVYTGYTGSEALTVQTWTGEDAAPLAGVATAAWAAAGQGTVDVTISGTATASLEPATYRLKLLVAGADAYEGMLEIGWSPGSATAPSVIYCSYRDLKALVPTLEKLRSKLEDQAGYLDQRIAATDWFQDLVHRHYRGCGGVASDFAFGPWLGGYGPFGSQVFRPGTRSATVQGWLDAGRLDVTARSGGPAPPTPRPRFAAREA
jgi:hypothetical protein